MSFDSPVEFWSDVHRRGDITWLTFSDPVDVLGLHRLNPRGLRVLDIGVGGGQMRSELISRENEVWGLDICRLAIESHYPKNGFVLSDLEADNTLPEVNLAIAHLVVQHCTDEQVSCLLSLVKLSEGGRISVQTADRRGPSRFDEMQGPLYFNPPEHYAGLFCDLGFSSEIVSSRGYENIVWSVHHLERP